VTGPARGARTEPQGVVLDVARDGRDWIAVVTADGSYEIVAGPTAARTARAAVDAACGGLPPLVKQDLRLLVSELVTNSVRHGGAGSDPVLLRFAVGPRSVRVAVTDHGAGFAPRSYEPAPEAESGYGLYLLDQIADRWGTSNAGAMTIWFELRRGRVGWVASVPSHLGRAARRASGLGLRSTARIVRSAARRHGGHHPASTRNTFRTRGQQGLAPPPRAAPSAAVPFSLPLAPGVGSHVDPAEARRPAGRE
jgi:anti-sigma regulatory factor (Ser/Thr protein kinase)